jgi:hypothetical protein
VEQDSRERGFVAGSWLGAPSGVELARLIHERHPSLPVVLVSGNLPDFIPEDIAESIPKEKAFPRLLEVIYREIGPLFPITLANGA